MGQKTDKILERARINLEKDNHENALRLFNEVLNREPGNPKALRSKAMLKIIDADKEEAEDFLLFAIDQQPKDDQLCQMLGTLYHNSDEPVKAKKYFSKAIDLNDANALAYRGLGMIHANHYGDHEQAVTFFTKAISLDGESDDLYFFRGCSHLILQNNQEAETDLSKASRLGHVKATEMIKKYFE